MIADDPIITLDARGLRCPLPLIRAKQRMAELKPGAVLKVKTTDPEAPIDLAAWCTDEGHTLLDQSIVDAGHESMVRKAIA